MKTGHSILFLFLLWIQPVHAQRVLYSPVISHRSTGEFEVIGRSGLNTWLHLTQFSKGHRQPDGSFSTIRKHYLEVFDQNLIPAYSFDYAPLFTRTEKEILLTGNNGLERLIITDSAGKRRLWLKRYGNAGADTGPVLISSFVSAAPAGGMVLLAPEDRSKYLLLCFEKPSEGKQTVLSLLFTSSWELLAGKTVHNRDSFNPEEYGLATHVLLQPFSSPVLQMNNAGDWAFLTASLHFSSEARLYRSVRDENSMQVSRIVLPDSTVVREMALLMDDKNRSVGAGLLGSTRNDRSTLVKTALFSFDTAASLYESLRPFVKQKLKPGARVGLNLSLRAFGNKGFVAVSEPAEMISGRSRRSFTPPVPVRAPQPDNTNRTADQAFSGNQYNNSGQQRWPDPGGYFRMNMDSLLFSFYPLQPGVSSWSQVLDKKQQTEKETLFLSYALFAPGSYLYFLYNNNFGREKKAGISAAFDADGKPVNAGDFVFWKKKYKLVFRKAYAISAEEMVIPFDKHWKTGFCLVRF